MSNLATITTEETTTVTARDYIAEVAERTTLVGTDENLLLKDLEILTKQHAKAIAYCNDHDTVGHGQFGTNPETYRRLSNLEVNKWNEAKVGNFCIKRNFEQAGHYSYRCYPDLNKSTRCSICIEPELSFVNSYYGW